MKPEAASTEVPTEAPAEVRFFIRGEKSQEKGNLLGAAACLEKALELNYRNEHPDSTERGMAHDIRKRLGEDIYPALEAEYREAGDGVSAEHFRQRAVLYHSPVEAGAVSWGEVLDLKTGQPIG